MSAPATRLSLLLLFVSMPLLASPKVAVLEIPSGDLTRDQAESLTDEIRRGALVQLGSGFEILTRENLLVLLKANGIDAASCEGECEVETGQHIGADFVASGRVVKFGKTFNLTLRLHSTQDGRLLASAKAKATSLDELPDAAEAACQELFAPLRKGTASAPAQVAEGKIGASPEFNPEARAEAVVQFESSPAGAIARLDGTLICQSTPCSRAVEPGEHEIAMEKERYAPASQRQKLAAGAKVSLALTPLFAILSIETKPAGMGVSLDGKHLEGSLADREVEPGAHEVVADDPCYAHEGERVSLQQGDKRSVQLAPQAKEAAVEVRAEDEQGNAVEADVRADDLPLGKAPGTFKLPLCTKLLVVTAADGRAYQTAPSLKERETIQIHAALAHAGSSLDDEALAFNIHAPRPRALLITELQGLESLYASTPSTSNDIPTLIFRLAEDYRELATAMARELAPDAPAPARAQSTAIRTRALGGAKKWYTAYLALVPAPPLRDQAFYARGLVELDSGENDKARADFSALIKESRSSRLVPYCYAQFGNLFFAERKFDLAQQSFEAALKIPNSSLEGYLWLREGEAQHEQQHDTPAIEAMVKSIPAARSANQRRVLVEAQRLAARICARICEPSSAPQLLDRLGGPEAVQMHAWYDEARASAH